MIYVSIPTAADGQQERHRLPFYLAVEEWVAEALPAGEYFFTWHVAPTVIFGRNQDPSKELDLEYCRDHGIDIVRRRSGGGCVYADNANLMISYITPSAEVSTTFRRFTSALVSMLRSLGVNAESTGRNDVVVDGHKLSGCAFYNRPNTAIVHSTLLVNVDTETMMHAITPSKSKLESKKVKSVASRVVGLSDYLPDMDIDHLQQYARQYFGEKEYVLTDKDLAEIKEIESKYYDLTWTFGRTGILSVPGHQLRTHQRIEGVGEFDLILTMDADRIADIEITGDFFVLSDLDTGLFDLLRGMKLDEEAIKDRLQGIDTSKIISGLNTETYISILTDLSKNYHKRKRN